MAYDAAVAAGVDEDILTLFVSSIIQLDQAWYVEAAGLSRAQQHRMAMDAVDAIFPRLETLLVQMGADPYITAPMVSAKKWTAYLTSLSPFKL
jgi:acyl-CoA oxidase